MVEFLDLIVTWFQDNTVRGLGVVLILLGLYLTISELRVYLRHQSSTEQLVLWGMVLIAGIFTTAFNDIVLGGLLGISLLMIVETVRMWTTPVWGKLMFATMMSYVVILIGKIGQMIWDNYQVNQLGVDPEDLNDQIFSGAFNIAFIVFLVVAFAFFGRKFVVVSRFSSPQIVYLFLFSILYLVIAQVFPRNDEGRQIINYLDLSGPVHRRLLFGDFGTYEALILVMIFMYFISGWLLTILFGVKPVTDPELLRKVKEVAEQMGIKGEVKVGYMRAPILNAFAYGPWFDKRVAFISNDLNDFTDDDIKGIVGHELAHAAYHHLLLLLLLNIAELGVKKGIGLPASALDYTFLPEAAVENVDFVQYYIISYGLVVILLIFVRVLEGHADKKTKDAGYGQELSQALYRLEGFYQGVASDFGISVNLLTDRTYTAKERQRFTAQAARGLYQEVLAPGRGAAFSNILQSHPRTSYRIASLVDENSNPMLKAFLPYRLLGFGFLRRRAIKEMNSVREAFKGAVDNTYVIDHGKSALEEVLEFSPWKEAYLDLINKEVIGYNRFDKKVYVGTFKEVSTSESASSPVEARIGEDVVDLALTDVKEYYPDTQYVAKNGEIMTLLGYHEDPTKGVLFTFQNNGTLEDKEPIVLSFAKLGKPLRYLKDLEEREIFLFENGITKVVSLDSIIFGDSFKNSAIIIDNKEYTGNELIISFPPIGFEVRKSKLEEQRPVIEHLINKKSLIYTKENFDVSLAGVPREITDDKLIVEVADGKEEISLDTIEYVIYGHPSIEVVIREHVSGFTKFGIWWSNRKKFNYIY